MTPFLRLIRYSCFTFFIFIYISKEVLAQVDLTHNLIGHWCLDGDALDNSGNNHDGSILGANNTTDRFENQKSAFDFDGINDEIIINHSFPELTLPFTVSAWIYKHKATQIKHLFSSSSQPTKYTGIYFSVYSDETLRISYGDGGPEGSFSRRTKISSTKVPLETWTHVMAVVRGATDMSLYINCEDAGGYYDGTGGDMVHSIEPARIARATHGNFWGGKIDDLKLYNRDLTAKEIDFLCNVETCEGDYCYSPPPEVSSPIEICSTAFGEVEVFLDGINLLWYNNPSLSSFIYSGNSFFPEKAGNYYVTQTIDDCESEPTELEIIEIEQAPSPNPVSSTINVCPEATIDLTSDGINLTFYKDFELTNELDPINYIVDKDEILYVTQTIDGCTSLPSEIRIKLERPVEPKTNSEDSSVCVGSTIAVEGENIKWYDNENNLLQTGSNEITANTIGAHEFHVTQTLNSCESEPIEFSVSVVEFNEHNILIPNAFSPNNDDINDSFHWIPIEAEACLGTFNRVLIMDRNGQSIFKSNDIEFQWEPVDLQGSFFYIIEFDRASFKGNLQIVK